MEQIHTLYGFVPRECSLTASPAVIRLIASPPPIGRSPPPWPHLWRSRQDKHYRLRPLTAQDQAIAYEAAIEAINDVIAGYSEQIAIAEQLQGEEAATRIAWLTMRTYHAITARDALNVIDTANVQRVLHEFCAITRDRDAREEHTLPEQTSTTPQSWEQTITNAARDLSNNPDRLSDVRKRGF